MLNDFKTQGEWKIQLTIEINIFSSKHFKETRTVHSKSNNIEIMMYNKTDEIIEELFECLLQKFKKGLEESMKGREFDFDSVDLLHYKCHEISFNLSGSSIDSPKWLKNKKATINPGSNDNKCFQYAIDYKHIVKNPQRISKIKFFINKYNWSKINFSLHKNGMKNKKRNNCSYYFIRITQY